MILYPAVDIRGGQAVRLTQGDYEREQIYDADPLEAARRWVAAGAEALHVVDLDGAREGRPRNLAAVRRICTDLEVPVQLGGGLRDEAAVAGALEVGVARVVLGTAALSNPELVTRLISEHGAERIVCALDSRAGRVSVEGWTEETEISPPELLGTLAAAGARTFIYTPVEVDGTMEGGDLDQLAPVAEAAGSANAELIYSGGIGSLDDLRALGDVAASVTGVIVGRALYEDEFTIAEAIETLG